MPRGQVAGVRPAIEANVASRVAILGPPLTRAVVTHRV